MAASDGSLGPRRFDRSDLRGARFVACDLTGVVMRGVDITGADIDAPWLLEGGEGALLVNGVDVAPYVEAELNRRFPGRAERSAREPDGLRAAWAALERTWAGTLARVAVMPAGSADVSVDGEWSCAQTLRHLVMATDTWLRGAVLGVERPFHPIGQPDTAADLAATRANPWAPQHPETVLSCLHTILEEEWEHHRFAVRDLDALGSNQAGRPQP
ncbi:DinB family protein [Aquipuribacter sp. MA13-6]|uniref:DinB family protein n=1 Tax=unclassified Aquipuribacter TaxID=2635084 RepID=UPI003EEC2317